MTFVTCTITEQHERISEERGLKIDEDHGEKRGRILGSLRAPQSFLDEGLIGR